jgi:hypothetical protein
MGRSVILVRVALLLGRDHLGLSELRLDQTFVILTSAEVLAPKVMFRVDVICLDASIPDLTRHSPTETIHHHNCDSVACHFRKEESPINVMFLRARSFRRKDDIALSPGDYQQNNQEFNSNLRVSMGRNCCLRLTSSETGQTSFPGSLDQSSKRVICVREFHARDLRDPGALTVARIPR